jgi:hypothetical protein
MDHYYSFIDNRENKNIERENYKIYISNSSPFKPILFFKMEDGQRKVLNGDKPLSSKNIDEWFVYTIFELLDVNETENFLNYQLQSYTGKKENFISYTNWLINEYISEKKAKSKVRSKGQRESPERPVNQERKKRIEKWLTDKENEFSNGNNIDTQSNSNVIITWNEQSNVLTDIFRQLKNIYNKDREPLIPNSYEELAVFLQKNFSCFSDTKLATIQTQLKKNDSRPKTSRVIEIKQTKN